MSLGAEALHTTDQHDWFKGKKLYFNDTGLKYRHFVSPKAISMTPSHANHQALVNWAINIVTADAQSISHIR